MQKIFNILSQTLSILMHPLFMPTYGMIMYMATMHARWHALPTIYIWVGIIGTLVLTALIPIGLICLLWKRGSISSWHIDNAKERTTPYIYALICFGFWCYFVAEVIQLPLVWTCIAIGATVALLLVTIINQWWKISAHLTGIGGLLGGICSIAMYYSIFPIILICCVLALSLFVMYARLHLNAHTPLQVVCGYLLGILCTFIPNLIIYYA